MKREYSRWWQVALGWQSVSLQTRQLPRSRSESTDGISAVDKGHPIQDIETAEEYPLVRLGTEYGGWTFVDEPELQGSMILSAGLGEDASFDVKFAATYDSTVVIVDPTPRAVDHFKRIPDNIGQKKTASYTDSGSQLIAAYDLSDINASQLRLVEKALWNETTDVRFYKPDTESHISHSITNWQHDYAEETAYIEGRPKRSSRC